jgi:paraquat-inducible protein B
MSRKASPTLIGAFVVGALALAVVGVLIFGSGRLFKKTYQFVLFFTGSVNGLNVGAPVKFKGVEVGSVKDIRLALANEPAGARIPVIIELDQEKIVSKGAQGHLGDPAVLKKFIDDGLRGQLNAQSFVTGLLFVQLDFVPDTPALLVAPPGLEIPEIPTIPTVLEKAQGAIADLVDKLQGIDLQALVKSFQNAADGVDRLVSSPGLKKTADDLGQVTASLQETLASFRALSDNLNAHTGDLATRAQQTTADLQVTLSQAKETLRTIDGFVQPESPLAIRIVAALDEIAESARSIRVLADYLERNPSAIVRGKDTGR